MKLKRIKKLRVNAYAFNVVWDKSLAGGWFSFGKKELRIGCKDADEDNILEIVCHELFEICAIEHYVRLQRPDVDSDYVFVFDHRQHTAIQAMFSGLLTQFLK